MKKRFLIIGSNSFSGSNMINLLLSKNHQVIGVSRSNEIEKEFINYKQNKNIKKFKFYKIDINKHSQRIKLNDIVLKFKPNIVINYSAQGMVEQSWINPEDWYQTNLVSQTIFYKNIQKFRFINKIIHVSTPEVYGSYNQKIKENIKFNPSTPYAISRAAMDLHLLSLYKNFRLPIILTRTANIYGPLIFDSGPGTPVEAVASWLDYKTMAEESGVKLVPNSDSNDSSLLAWAPL